MNFDKRASQIILEAGGYIGSRSRAKNPQEALNDLRNHFKIIENNAKLLKAHPDRLEVDSDSYNKVLEIIAILNEWGPQLKDRGGRPLDIKKETTRALDITNRPEHDYNNITSETKLREWKPLYRKWFALYSKYMEFKATDRRSISQAQEPNPMEIFYFGTDNMPYVTRLNFDSEGMVHGTIFLRTNRFNDIQVDQYRDDTGKPVKPLKFEKGKPKGSIPLNADVERTFGKPEISRDELKQILNSDNAEKQFKKRIAGDAKLKAWYDKKYSKVNTEKL